ncbi:MAG: ABC transporter permease [Acidobacteriaceae bacterium]
MDGWGRRAANRVRAFFGKSALDRDLDAEMASHLEMAVEENVRSGMNPEEARRRAMVRFGGVQRAREEQRASRGLPFLDIMGQDLHYTVRTLRRDAGFTVVAVLILALGIGANVAVFSVVNTLLLRPLPFPEAQRLVRIATVNPVCGESCRTYSADATREFQERNHSFSSVTGYFAFTGPNNFKLTDRAVPVPVTGILVMDNFFQTLGVQPMLGRLFLPEEALHGSRATAVLSYAFWKRQFGGDRSIVGRAVSFNGTPVTVIGVLPETFDFGSVFSPGSRVDMFVPYVMSDFENDGNDLALMARLKPGVTLAQAQEEANRLFPELDADLKHPEWKPHYTAHVTGMKEYVSGKLRRSLVVLWAAVGMILLIVCVNLSNLLLARAAARSREFAMRMALGASRGRIVRQLLIESLVLSVAGSALGLGIAVGVTRFVAHSGSIALPLLTDVGVDGAAVAWTVGLAFVAAVLFGLVPALRMARGPMQEALKDSGHGMSEGRRHEGLRSALVISEVALACVLLVGAGLLLRSFLHLLDVDLGFQPEQADTISLDFDDGQKSEARVAQWQEIQRRVEAIPGVETAGITDNLPLSRNRSWGIQAKGVEYRPGQLQGTFVFIVSPGYVEAIGMRLVEGRDFRWDDSNKPPGVIINETVARALWPGQDPIGRIAEAGGADVQVIGVIADVHESTVEGGGGWQMYLPVTAPQFGPEGADLVVRSALPAGTLAGSVMATLRGIDPGQPATQLRPLQALVDHSMSPRRFFVLLVGIFAGLGLLLAALGIYGVIAYSVTRQTQEIGIRMALGASRGRVQRAVLGRTLGLVSAGLVVGMFASLAASRGIASLLYGTEPTDWVTYVGMAVLLLAVAVVAGYLPARRASRVDPLVALRTN